MAAGRPFHPLPAAPVILVTGPGQLSVGIGSEMIASLNGGLINGPSLDVFTASWLSESFADVRNELCEMHVVARARPTG